MPCSFNMLEHHAARFISDCVTCNMACPCPCPPCGTDRVHGCSHLLAHNESPDASWVPAGGWVVGAHMGGQAATRQRLPRCHSWWPMHPIVQQLAPMPLMDCTARRRRRTQSSCLQDGDQMRQLCDADFTNRPGDIRRRGPCLDSQKLTVAKSAGVDERLSGLVMTWAAVWGRDGENAIGMAAGLPAGE